MKKLIFLAIALCLASALIFGMTLTTHADAEKNGTFNGSPAHVDGSGNLYVDKINFPDANFRAYVSEKADADSDGLLTLQEAAAMTEIGCSGRNIFDLSGIEFFTALTNLECYDNDLSSIDLSKNTVLSSLNVTGNALTELNVSGCKKLLRLYCSRNALISLDVSGCTNLFELQCHNNALTSLDLSANTRLYLLYCENNALTSLDVSANTALTDLHCSGNELASLDVSKNTALTSLYCYDNALTELNVSANAKLKYLSCYNNALTSLDVSKCRLLYTLRCYGNALTSLDLYSNSNLPISLTSKDISPQYCGTAVITKQDGAYTIDLAAIAGSDALSRITKVTTDEDEPTDGTLDASAGTVTFAEYPGDIVYYYDVPKANSPHLTMDVYVKTVCIHNEDESVIETRNATPATCTEEGYTGDTVCSVCGELIEEGIDIEKLPHNYEKGKCTMCGEDDPNYVLLGDVDGDGEITNADALLIFKYIFDPIANPLDPAAADVNHDGKITNEDALLIFKYIFDPVANPLK